MSEDEPAAMEGPYTKARRGQLKTKVTRAATKLQQLVKDDGSDKEAFNTQVLLAENWQECKEKGVTSIRGDSVSSDEEATAEEGGERVEAVSPSGRRDEKGTPKPAAPTETQLTLTMLMQMQEQMQRFNDFMQHSMLADESTPIRGSLGRPPTSRRPQFAGGTPGIAGLTTIRESEPEPEVPTSKNEELSAIKSMAESFKVLAERSINNSKQQTVLQEPTVKMPKFKLFRFSGETIDYLPFIRAFETQIESKFSDPTTLLGILIDNTSGSLQDRLHFCAVENEPAEAYRQAREILRKKYGQFEDLAQAWMDKLAKVSRVTSVGQLEEFNSMLNNCLVTLRSMNQLQEFETKANLMGIVSKFPGGVKERWQKRVVDIREDEGRSATLADLIRLLERVYLEKCDPVYGGSLDNSSPDGRGLSKGGVSRSTHRQAVHTQVEASAEYVESVTRSAPAQRNNPRPPLACTCCGGGHTLYRCPQFKDMLPADRKGLVETRNVCSNCFHLKHTLEQCRSEHRCHVCREKHHTMLHIDGSLAVNALTALPTGADLEEGIVANTMLRGRVALPVLLVVVKGPRGEFRVYVLLDQGSTCSLVTDGLVERLGLAVRPYSTDISTVNGKTAGVRCGKVDMTITSLYTQRDHVLKGVVMRPTLNLSSKCCAYKDELDKWPHLRDLDLPTADAHEVELLIGYSHPEYLYAEESRRAPNKQGPTAHRTILGWYIGGPLEEVQEVSISCNAITMGMGFPSCWDEASPEITVQQPEPGLEEKVERFWQVDGTQALHEKLELSRDEQRVVDEWRRDMYHDGRNYHVPIPFKDRSEVMEDNRAQALHLLYLLGKRLSKDPVRAEKYRRGMNKYFDGNCAEPVPDEELDAAPGRTFYLTHHDVYSEKKEDPRIVYNSSLKYRGRSLNDYVFAGPDLMNQLLDVLLKFRQDQTVLQGDIEGMFNQILVIKRDRDAQRFVWWEGGIPGGKVRTYRMKSHIFGGVWSPSCVNFTLKKVAEDFGGEFQEKTSRTIRDRFYLDDGLASESSTEAATRLAGELDQMLGRGGFNFTKLLSNNPAVLREVPREKLAKSVDVETLEFGSDDVTAVLGCGWKPRRDKLVYPNTVPEKPSTRRGVLSAMSSLYDPIGLVSPVAIGAKRIFQESCRRQIAWDQELDEDLASAWEDWKGELERMSDLEFQRCFLPDGYTLDDGLTFELHIFGDASRAAYGAVGYLRSLKEGSPVGVTLIMAKGKLAPIRMLSIPRLELTAAEMGVLLEQLLRRALDLEIERTYYWTDSMIVIWYLLNKGKRYKTFVHNRVTFITSHTEDGQWKHIPSALNPADILSRGASPEELMGNHLWHHGPEFLMQDKSQWPGPVQATQVEESMLELRKESAMAIQEWEEVVMGVEMSLTEESVNVTASEPERSATERYLSLWSSWHKLKRKVIYWVRAFRWYLLKRRGKLTSDAVLELRKPIRTQQLKQAETGVIIYLQRSLKNAEGEVNPKYMNLSPYFTEGIIRVGGRLRRADLHPHRKHPILMPSGAPTRAFLLGVHREQGHGSEQRMLSEARKRFWILGAKKLIADIVYRCIICRKAKAHMLQPKMADLHPLRVLGEPWPFSNTGVDYFGPMVVRVGRVDRKRYGCLFTCLMTRAVHLELAWSLEMDSCVKAILRFAAHRGMPEEMSSDNGTNFIGAEGALERAIKYWNQSQLSDYFLQRGCNWSFNPPAASHMGGAWERMIRSERTILLCLAEEQKMTEEALLTSLCVVEDVLNNRPITPVSADADDCAALTPNHLLSLDTCVRVPVALTDEKDAYRRRWLQVQHVANVFWQRWRDDYLPTLQIRNKWNVEQRNLKVGDLVILRDDMAPRGHWPMGRVTRIFPDDRGMVRSAEIRTGKGATMRRPVTKLGLLERCG